MNAEIWTDVVYAAIHEFGHPTGYWIHPSEKKALHFMGTNGEEVFAKAVWMPPRAPKPFLKPAVEAEFSSGRAKMIAEQELAKFIGKEQAGI
jgi:phage gpG-like protein